MSTDKSLQDLEDALTSRRLNVERTDHRFDVSKGKGIMAQEAQFDATEFLAQLGDDPRSRKRQIAAFASGVNHVLLEPGRSKAADWDFVESAGGLIPGIHAQPFERGVLAAAGEPAWTLDFVDDLKIAYFIKLDMGIRVLTAPQVERWGVSDDRVTSAARSILFHKTRDLSFERFDDANEVRRLHAGDGHDAARCLVVGDAFYGDIDDGFRFTMPTPEHFLCVMDATPERLEELQRLTESSFDDATYPLSTRLFRFETGKPVPAEDN